MRNTPYGKSMLEIVEDFREQGIKEGLIKGLILGACITLSIIGMILLYIEK